MGGGRGGRSRRREAARVFRSIARRPGGVPPVLRGLDGPHRPVPSDRRRGYGTRRTRGVRGTVKISVWVVSAFPGPSRAVDGVQFVSRRRGARARALGRRKAARSRPVGRRRRACPTPGRRSDRVASRNRRSRVLFFAPPRAHRFSRARQRVLRTEQQPPRHLVRRGHGRRRRGAERVESSAVGARGRARVRASPRSRRRRARFGSRVLRVIPRRYVRGGTVVARASSPVRIARAS